MKVQQLKEDETIKEWLMSVNAKQNTERNYLMGMQFFTEFTGKEPEDLINEAEDEIKNGVLPRRRSIKKYLNEFRKYLEDKGNAPQTVKTHMTGVKSFYTSFDIEIPKTLKSEKAQTLKQNKDIPTKEDMQEVIKVCDVMEKAIVLTGISSGLSANEIINLRVKDFKKGYDSETGITTLDLRRGKVDFDFITFLSPECSNAILDYLEYRNRTIKTDDWRRKEQVEKQRVFSDDNYLFIKRKIPVTYLNDHNENHRKHDRESFMKVYRFISEKCQKNTPAGDWNLIRSHNIRKFFNSALLNAGADSFHVEYYMGHTLDATRAAYFRADTQKLREMYAKYIPYITIEKALDIAESEEFKKTKADNETLIIEAEKNRIERNELVLMKAEIEKLKAEKENAISDFQISEHEKLSTDSENAELRNDLNELRAVLNKLLKKEGIDIDTPMTKQEKKANKKDDW